MKICSIESCGTKVLARGWCSRHLSRFYNHGDPLTLLHKTVCKIQGCGGKHCARGLCSRHFNKLRRSEGYFSINVRQPNTRFTDSKRSAKARNLEWSIPFEIYRELILKSCTYCSGPLPETKTGLDRIDNDKGYLTDNVVPCCRYCNQLRSDIFTYEEFIEFSKTSLFKTILNRLHHRNK